MTTVAATGTAPSSSVDTGGPSSASTDTDVSSGPSEQQPPEQQQQTKHMHMSEPLYAYLLQHTREPAVLAALRADTAAQFPAAARMAISPEQGAFLAWLLRTLQARRVIEVGVFTGYSSIALALALPPTGTLLACDRDPRSMALARDYWAKAGVADKVGWCAALGLGSLCFEFGSRSQQHLHSALTKRTAGSRCMCSQAGAPLLWLPAVL